jgi:geranylgeranyl pyrophosphate synthase
MGLATLARRSGPISHFLPFPPARQASQGEMTGRVARVIELVGRAGGLAYARERATEWAEQAEAALEELPRSQAREALRDAIVYAVERRH